MSLCLLGAGLSAPSSPPAAPSSLTATAISDTEIDLEWTDNSDDETGFSVERKEGAGAYAEVATPAANATTYSDTGLDAETEYTYRVRAVRSGTYSAYSNEDAATTEARSQVSGFSSFTGDGGGSQAFANHSRLSDDDSLYATVTLGAGETSEGILCTDGQGFTLPDEASPTGFLISVKFKTDGEPADLVTNFKGIITANTSLYLDGSPIGSPDQSQLGTFGSSSSTSDVTQATGEFTVDPPITGADVKDSTFGISFFFANTGSNPVTVSVNYASLRVYY